LLALQWLKTGNAEILADIRQRLQFFLENEGYLNIYYPRDQITFFRKPESVRSIAKLTRLCAWYASGSDSR
jgi:hypothetical protein